MKQTIYFWIMTIILLANTIATSIALDEIQKEENISYVTVPCYDAEKNIMNDITCKDKTISKQESIISVIFVVSAVGLAFCAFLVLATSIKTPFGEDD